MIWTKSTIGEAFEFVRNGKSVQQDKSGDGLPITRIETIANWSVDPSRVGYAGIEETGNEKWLLKKGDILFSHINSVEHIGKCALYEGVPQKLIHGMNLLAMRPHKLRLDPKFALYLLGSPGCRQAQAPFINKAVNQASISTTNLKSLEIFLPPLVEQRRIAAILDQADALRRKRREALAKLDTFSASLMSNTLREQARAITRCQLESLIRNGDRINYGVVQPGEETEGGVPMIRVENVVAKSFDDANLKNISSLVDAQYQRSRLQGDEILVACVGSIGAVALASPSLKGANIARAVARVPLDPKIADRTFVGEFLRGATVQAYFKSETRTVAQPTLNIGQLCETPIDLPPLPTQRAFAARVAEIETIKTAHRAHLEKLDALFAVLQHRAFRGELTGASAVKNLELA